MEVPSESYQIDETGYKTELDYDLILKMNMHKPMLNIYIEKSLKGNSSKYI